MMKLITVFLLFFCNLSFADLQPPAPSAPTIVTQIPDSSPPTPNLDFDLSTGQRVRIKNSNNNIIILDIKGNKKNKHSYTISIKQNN